jgi:hypothetical protein
MSIVTTSIGMWCYPKKFTKSYLRAGSYLNPYPFNLCVGMAKHWSTTVTRMGALWNSQTWTAHSSVQKTCRNGSKYRITPSRVCSTTRHLPMMNRLIYIAELNNTTIFREDQHSQFTQTIIWIWIISITNLNHFWCTICSLSPNYHFYMNKLIIKQCSRNNLKLSIFDFFL